jgi:hypothetical protein
MSKPLRILYAKATSQEQLLFALPQNYLARNFKARRFAATFRDGVSKGKNRDSPLWLLVRIHFAPTLKFLKFKLLPIFLETSAPAVFRK